MELSKACIINAAWGKWYPQGQQRLVESLRYRGFAGKILTWCNEPINNHFNPENPYTIKAAAFVEAMAMGYTHILWLDCSVWAVKNPNKFFDLISEEGVYFWKSGYNLAQTAADSDLKFAGISRDEAERLDECASAMVGINMEKPQSRALMNIFLKANAMGVCSTSREHAGQSKDPRFLFARQDQTAFTIAFHKAGYKKMYDREYSAYYYDDAEYPKTTYFLMQGI